MAQSQSGNLGLVHLIIAVMAVLLDSASLAQAQEPYPIVIVAPDAQKDVPDVSQGITSFDCTLVAPCRFGNTSGPWKRVFNQHIILSFLPGLYELPYESLFSAYNHDLIVRSSGEAVFNANGTIAFGLPHSPPKAAAFLQMTATLTGTHGFGFFASSGISITLSRIVIDGPCPTMAIVSLLSNGGDVVAETSSFKARNYGSNAPTLFAAVSSHVVDWKVFVAANTIVRGFDRMVQIDSDQILLTVGFFVTNSFFASPSGTASLISTRSQSQPDVRIGLVAINGSTLIGLAHETNAIQALASKVIVRESFLQGRFRLITTELTWIQLSEFFNCEVFVSSATPTFITGVSVRHSSFVTFGAVSSVHRLDTFHSTFYLLQPPQDPALPIPSGSFVSEWHAIDTFAVLNVSQLTLIDSSFQRHDTAAYLDILSSKLWVIDSEFYIHGGSAMSPAILRLSPPSALSPLIPHVVFIGAVDGLELFGSPKFTLLGLPKVAYSLTAPQPTTIEFMGLLTFVSDILTGSPVVVDHIHFQPMGISILGAAVWSLEGSAAYLTSNSSLDPSLFGLRVTIKNGRPGNAARLGSKLTLFEGPGLAPNDKHFVGFFPGNFDASYGFGGSPVYAPGNVSFSINAFSCPDECNKNGECVGVNTCKCFTGFSGHACGCNHQIPGFSCSSDYHNRIDARDTITVAPQAQVELPENFVLKSMQGVSNSGALKLKDARYEFGGTITNEGTIEASTGVKMLLDREGKCRPVTTASVTASHLNLAPNSTLTLNIDISGAKRSLCPSPFDNAGLKRSLSAIDPIALDKGPKTTAQGATDIWVDKVSAMVDVDAASLSGGVLVVNLVGSASEDVTVTLVNTRNTTSGKSIPVDGEAPLKVELKTNPGSCGDVKHEANLITLFVTPCPPPSNSKNNWIRWGIPVIVFGTILIFVIVFIIIVLAVPEVKEYFRPYHGAN